MLLQHSRFLLEKTVHHSTNPESYTIKTLPCSVYKVKSRLSVLFMQENYESDTPTLLKVGRRSLFRAPKPAERKTLCLLHPNPTMCSISSPTSQVSLIYTPHLSQLV